MSRLISYLYIQSCLYPVPSWEDQFDVWFCQDGPNGWDETRFCMWPYRYHPCLSLSLQMLRSEYSSFLWQNLWFGSVNQREQIKYYPYVNLIIELRGSLLLFLFYVCLFMLSCLFLAACMPGLNPITVYSYSFLFNYIRWVRPQTLWQLLRKALIGWSVPDAYL